MRGYVLVHALDELGGEVERDAELLRDRPGLECAVRREVCEPLVGGVVAVGEAEGVGEVTRPHRGSGFVVEGVVRGDRIVAQQIDIGERVTVGGCAPGDHVGHPRFVVGMSTQDAEQCWRLKLAPLLRHGCREVSRIKLIDDLAERGVGVEEESGGAHEWGGYSGVGVGAIVRGPVRLPPLARQRIDARSAPTFAFESLQGTVSFCL